jgi:hypothetical protein
MIEKPKPKPKRHKMTVECDISTKVRQEVYKRDSCESAPCCIICGSPRNLEVCHCIPRSQTGLGIPENLFTGCRECHDIYDEGDTESIEWEEIAHRINEYMNSKYEGWYDMILTYDGQRTFDSWRRSKIKLDPSWLFDNLGN